MIPTPERESSMSKAYQRYIVNLSAIHGLASRSDVLDNFAELHYLYANSWLGKWYSRAWVSLKSLTMNRSINDYKLGRIDTDSFINKLQDIFYFIPADKNPKELLANAWNSLITWNDESTARLKTLLNKNQSIYFISNTNPLNIEKIIELFNQNSDITWELPEQTEAKPLEITKNFYLCASYLFKEFKEDTPGLISELVNNFLKEIKPENILLVSQYQPDLDKAKVLGIEYDKASQFFPTFPEVISSQSFMPLSKTTSISQPRPLLSVANNSEETSRNRRSFFTKNSNVQEEIQDTSETSTLLKSIY